ncbi:MAG: hypothetical protein MRZ79_07820 [Bacteroidia bacterium]|nr:hypothetical protein [Bacteroidia bacterium]
MKKGLLLMSMLCLSLPLILWGINSLGSDVVNADTNTEFTKLENPDIKSFVKKIEGTWVNESFVASKALNSVQDELEPEILIDIRSAHIKGKQLAIYIAEYCRPEEAEYLLFGFDGEKLTYEGAEWEGCVIDIARIDFMQISLEEKQSLEILTFEAREVDHQNHQKIKLLRLPEETTQVGWHCTMQYHLIEILTKGSYSLFNPDFKELTLLEAFGKENLLDELTFFEAFHTTWPMYEEICVSAPFEIVVLGENHPKGQMNIYGIEWNSSEIRLYETHVAKESEDGVFPLVKGDLKVILIPKLQFPPLENF